MTLTVFRSDKLFSNKIGVPVANTDPIPNPYMRQQLLLAIKTLLKSEAFSGKIQIYSHWYEVVSDVNRTLEDLKKELDYDIATKNVLLKNEEENASTEDYNFIKNQLIAYNNINNLIEQQIEKGVK